MNVTIHDENNKSRYAYCAAAGLSNVSVWSCDCGCYVALLY